MVVVTFFRLTTQLHVNGAHDLTNVMCVTATLASTQQSPTFIGQNVDEMN